MAQYSEKFKGYVADVPELYLKRCDGRIFHFDELTQASTTINQQNTEINAGWSLFPVATLPGQSTMEISCSSAKFEPELFAFAAAEEFKTVTTYTEYVSEIIAAATADTIVLTDEPAEDEEYLKNSDGTVSTQKRSSVSIVGFTEIPTTGTLAAGQYQVAKATKTITFFTGEVAIGTKVTVDYKKAVGSIEEMQTNNQGTAICEVFANFPVYSDGTDCTTAGVIGNVYLTIYRARVSAQPTLGGSYKTAATFDFTLSAIDAKRSDGKVYSIAYKKKA